MPGSVANATPATVLPRALCAAFRHSRAFSLQMNQYRNGETQRSLDAATSRKFWGLSVRLAPTQLVALRNFFDSRRGVLEAFYFYDAYDASPVGSNWDASGVNATGRYTVRFEGGWSQETGMARSDASISLVEVN